MDEGSRRNPQKSLQELRAVPAAMLSQWRERFRSLSRVRCPRPGCWLEFPSLYGLKYHYQRCQGAVLTDRRGPTEARLRKPESWNHPGWSPAVTSHVGPYSPEASAVKGGSRKRSAEVLSPVLGAAKVTKAQVMTPLSRNGEQVPRIPAGGQTPGSSSSSDTSSWTSGSSESESDSPSPLPQEEEERDQEDEVEAERARHRRKQKTPKKFTGDQPTLSSTFGLKGRNHLEDRLKCRRMADGNGFVQRCPRRERPALHSGPPEAQRRPPPLEQTGSEGPTRRPASGPQSPHSPQKHTEVCQKLQDAVQCLQCRQHFRSRAGLEFHAMTEHGERSHSGKKDVAEVRMPLFQCQHCGKTYRSKAGREYHLRSAHCTLAGCGTTGSAQKLQRQQEVEQEEQLEVQEDDGSDEDEQLDCGSREEEEQAGCGGREEEEQQEGGRGKEAAGPERGPGNGDAQPVGGEQEDCGRTPSGRVRRHSAQVAVFHLQEIAEDELASSWGGRRHRRDDLVPDSRKLNYTRPQPLTLSPGTTERWRAELKEKGFICCSNSDCGAVYSSAAGLKAHLAGCEKGGGTAGRYTCLLCQKEFGSESGVKYHISKAHSQNWFRTSNRPAPNSGPKETSNGLKGASESSAAGKKRGRKPREQPAGGDVEPENRSAASETVRTEDAPPLALLDPGALGEGDHFVPDRDTNSPLRRRVKPKKIAPSFNQPE
ncbi:zinc finger protein 512B-like [Scleropages formosus]|uniref:Zinc finger protein 512B n=1 Tax=Scleropages formosus TaxID=113540 RepID=A0A8C9VYZ4_SCLFO|nr:zinc finger protein 512B-like [Scleropages formosus]